MKTCLLTKTCRLKKAGWWKEDIPLLKKTGRWKEPIPPKPGEPALALPLSMTSASNSIHTLAAIFRMGASYWKLVQSTAADDPRLSKLRETARRSSSHTRVHATSRYLTCLLSSGVGGHAVAGFSRTTDLGALSSRMPSKEGCRRIPSRVHVVNFTATTTRGSAHIAPRLNSRGTDSKGESLR